MLVPEKNVQGNIGRYEKLWYSWNYRAFAVLVGNCLKKFETLPLLTCNFALRRALFHDIFVSGI